MTSGGNAKGVAVARILTGLIFIAEGYAKVTGGFVRGGFADSVRETASGRAWPFWSAFLERVVAGNAGAFGWFFAVAELALGIALVFGLLASGFLAARGVSVRRSLALRERERRVWGLDSRLRKGGRTRRSRSG